MRRKEEEEEERRAEVVRQKELEEARREMHSLLTVVRSRRTAERESRITACTSVMSAAHKRKRKRGRRGGFPRRPHIPFVAALDVDYGSGTLLAGFPQFTLCSLLTSIGPRCSAYWLVWTRRTCMLLG